MHPETVGSGCRAATTPPAFTGLLEALDRGRLGYCAARGDTCRSATSSTEGHSQLKRSRARKECARPQTRIYHKRTSRRRQSPGIWHCPKLLTLSQNHLFSFSGTPIGNHRRFSDFGRIAPTDETHCVHLCDKSSVSAQPSTGDTIEQREPL